MNTVIIMLVSLTMGTVAGAISALVVIDIKTEELLTQIHSIKNTVDNVVEISQIQNETVQKSQENTMLINDALQIFIGKYSQDKTWIMQSLNDLWADYDRRHKKTEKETAEAKSKRKTPKRTQAKDMQEELMPEAKKDVA